MILVSFTGTHLHFTDSSTCRSCLHSCTAITFGCNLAMYLDLDSTLVGRAPELGHHTDVLLHSRPTSDNHRAFSRLPELHTSIKCPFDPVNKPTSIGHLL